MDIGLSRNVRESVAVFLDILCGFVLRSAYPCAWENLYFDSLRAYFVVVGADSERPQGVQGWVFDIWINYPRQVPSSKVGCILDHML